MSRYHHWGDVLDLRPELLDAKGHITNLQMSLYAVAYRTRDVPYEDVDYYSDITEPTPGLIRFMGTIARRLGAPGSGRALFHLDQGMGGGKSHALVGLHHMAASSDSFFSTGLGALVRNEAEQQADGSVDLTGTRVVILSGDHMTPGQANPEFGPATTLHERFLWSLFRGEKALYQQFVSEGPNKAALRRAFEQIKRPVLILLDELMDYALHLSDEEHIRTMPGEQAFLSALMDVVDDVPQVAFVIVMIRSDADERGYNSHAESFRDFIGKRIERNGATDAVTEAQDFAGIIQRRIFTPAELGTAVRDLVSALKSAADLPWREQVFDRLGGRRGLTGLAERVERTYPFHPDLMHLVENDWSRHAHFQHVRSTVGIFAATAHHWSQEHRAGRWSPPLINVGDLPLDLTVEHLLSSGLLHGNERAIQGFRQVAAADVVSKDGTQGRAVAIDRVLEGKVSLTQPRPAQRMATALFCYSLVPRSQGKTGATKAELLAAVFGPEEKGHFTGAEEVLNSLLNDEDGLGALDVRQSNGGGSPTRYQLSTSQTLRMFYKQARSMVGDAAERDHYIWQRTRHGAKSGVFDDLVFVDAPQDDSAPLARVFAEVDQKNRTRLVVLDPRHWTLLNGADSRTRGDITSLLGLGDNPLPVDNAASCVVACVNTQRRDTVRKRASEALAWRMVADLDLDDDQRREALEQYRDVERKLDEDLERAFQHYAYLVRADETKIEWKRFDADDQSSLKGHHVWSGLVTAGRAVAQHSLTGAYLKILLDGVPRSLSMKEIVQQFYSNPSFPLVASDDDIRHAIFEVLRIQNGYEAADSDGNRLTIASPGEITLHSTEVLLRAAKPAEHKEGSVVDVPERPDTGETGGGETSRSRGGGGGTQTYREYILRLRSTSLANLERRDAVWKLIGALEEALDPANGRDLQLMEFDLKITAGEGDLSSLQERAGPVEAKWEEYEELF